MKKRSFIRIAAMGVLLVCLAGAACFALKNGTEATGAPKSETVWKQNPKPIARFITDESANPGSFCDAVAKLRTTKQREFGIPIYTKEELINAGEHVLSGFYYDAYWHGMKNSLPNASIEVFRNLPTSGIRFRDEGSFYSMYDIDGEYRLFVFFSEQNNYLSPVGYPVIVKQPLAYEAFSSINIGDKAEAVITVDPGSELVIERILTINEYDEAEAVFQYNEKCGKTVSTLHYLTDGVLRIDYGLNEAGDVVIEAMTYGADWKLANAGGVIIDYRILPEDLDF